MPLRIDYRNTGQQCTIRPTPLISIGTNLLKNSAGEPFGVTYTITLNGTILADEGSPYSVDNVASQGWEDGSRHDFGNIPSDPNEIGPYGKFDNDVSHFTTTLANNDPEPPNNRPPQQYVHLRDRAQSIFSKQRVLRGLFSVDGQRMELSDIDGEQQIIVCYPRTISIDFEEGIYINTCNYTIVLEADTLLQGFSDDDDSNLVPDVEGVYIVGATGESPDQQYNSLTGSPSNTGILNLYDDTHQLTEKKLIEDFHARFISDYSENWSIEVDEQTSEGYLQKSNPNFDQFLPRTYVITHTISAVGKKHYVDPNISSLEGYNTVDKDWNKDGYGNPIEGIGQGTMPAWLQAKKFVTERLSDINPSGTYPNVFGQIGKGTVDLIQNYRGYNHVVTEEVDMPNGSYSATETWIIASGNALENWSASINSSLSTPYVTVNIDGSVKGLSDYSPKGYHTHERQDPDSENYGVRTGFENALTKYHEISNSGTYGYNSEIFKRVNRLVSQPLNSAPNSIAIGTNEFTGDITYSLSFDNRPTNVISGVLSEDIQVTDTYPGDVFAVVPVIGRPTGPVLQYIGGRTEYKRDVSINLIMDSTKIPYGKTRNPLILKKPSIVEPTATQIANLLKELSPAGEPGIRKYFISPPQENWNPKDGSYSFSISWTYELDK